MALTAHKTDDSVLTLTSSDLPAVFTDRPADNVSDRYVHINTGEFIPQANLAGWDLFNAGSKKRNRKSLSKNPDAQRTAGHFLAFRPSEDWLAERGLTDKLVYSDGIGRLSKAIPRLIVYNGHDKTTALKAVLGLFEFVCSNASIMCSDSWGQWKFRHMNINPAKILDFFRRIIEVAPYIIETRDAMSRIEVTKQQALELAENVINLRWDGEKYAVNPESLIVPRFQEQSDLTAYNVLQTIQHHLIQGGDHIQNRENKKFRKQRKITNFAVDLAVNQGLWDHTNAWLNGMGHQLPSPPRLDIDVR